MNFKEKNYMRIKFRIFLAVAVIALFTTVFANSAQAQWTLIDSDNDFEGKEIKRVEKHANGATRTMTRIYFPGTRIIQQEVVITKSKDNSRSRIEERRDKQNRVTFLMNEFKNAKGAKVRGVQQWWSYKNLTDRYGTQKNFKYNPQTDSWSSF